MFDVEILGWISAFAFVVYGLPQSIHCYRDGHARGLSATSLILWWIGEISIFAYVLLKHGWDWPLMSNYLANMIWLIIICKYKWWERV